jgi:uncharacterized membrane protein HdeD (DUF308 family)
MEAADPSLADMQRVVKTAFSLHWKLFLFQGAVMIILGGLAICAPLWATLFVDIYVGWLFLIAGVMGFVALISAHHVHAFVWSLVTATLSVAVGALLIWKPVEGALSLTLVLTAFFILEGIFQSALAIAHRQVLAGTWVWMLVSGLSDLVLAAIIIAGWPGTAVWALGLLVGVNLLMSGCAVVSSALAGRDIARNTAAVGG